MHGNWRFCSGNCARRDGWATSSGIEADAGRDAHRGNGRAQFGVGIDHGRDGLGQGNRGADVAQTFAPRTGPFVAINCSAIPETLMESEIFGHERGAFTGAAERRIGCFELADAGTLLLDEIGEMPAPTQAKLLRVLEDRKVRRLGSKSETPVDVRVLAATNKEPEQAVSSGQFAARSLLSAECVSHQLAAAAGAQGRYSAAGRAYSARRQRQAREACARDRRGSPGHFHGAHLAGKHPRTAQRIGARRDHVRKGPDYAREPPGRIGMRAAKGPSDLSAIKFPVGTTVDAMERVLILQTLAQRETTKHGRRNLLGISLKTLHNKLKEYGSDRAEAE